MAYAYLTAQIDGRHGNLNHHAAVADAVLAACD
jgi:hypothetical protein